MSNLIFVSLIVITSEAHFNFGLWLKPVNFVIKEKKLNIET